MTQDVRFDASAPNPIASSPKKNPPVHHRKTRHFDWCSGPHNPTKGEAALWMAVITQAMMDALSKATNSEARYHKHEAIRWLTGNGRNFITVCQLADVDPDYIRRKAKRTLASPVAWRAEAGKGKRYLERKAYRKALKTPKKPLPDEDAGRMVITGPWLA